MTIKTFILSEDGKILDRVIKTEDGKEYILHKGMKAFLEHFRTDEHGRFIVVQKKIAYYEDK